MDSVLATTQFSYSITSEPEGDLRLNRFQSLALTPRCTLSGSRTDARGITMSTVENQVTLFRAADPTSQTIDYGIYDRDYSASLGRCLPIGEAEALWSEDPRPEARAEVTYRYDTLHQVTGIDYPLVGADRAQIQVEYDLLGRIVEMRDPDSGCTEFVFDNLNNLVERTASAFEPHPEADCSRLAKPTEVRRFAYAADRLTGISYRSLDAPGGANDASEAVRFYYDRYPHARRPAEVHEPPRLVPNEHADRRFVDVTGRICENCIGQIAAISDRTGARSFSYTALGQPHREVRSVVAPLATAVDGGADSEAKQPEVAFYELERGYSVFGDLTRQEFNESAPTNPSRTCDARGAETCIARFTLGTRNGPDGKVAQLLFNGRPLIRSAHDALGRPALRVMSDGTTTGYYYDPLDLRLNQMATITAAEAHGGEVPVAVSGYQYDGGGNVLGYRTMAEYRGAADEELEAYRSRFWFAYDGANRLTQFEGHAFLETCLNPDPGSRAIRELLRGTPNMPGSSGGPGRYGGGLIRAGQ